MILVIDNSKQKARIALVGKEGKVVVYKELTSEKTRTGQILLTIKKVLAKLDADYRDLSAIGWINGFGSFTSLRVTATIVNGLGYGLQIPVVTTNWLEVLSLLAPRPNTVIWKNPREDFFVAEFKKGSKKTAVTIQEKVTPSKDVRISNAAEIKPEILIESIETKELFLSACKLLHEKAEQDKGKPYVTSLPMYVRDAVQKR